MLKKFIEGLVFGSGFGISFIILSCLAVYVLYPVYLNRPNKIVTEKISTPVKETSQINYNQETAFSKLSLNEKIETSSFIVIAEFQKSSSGKQVPIIKEFLKKDPNSEIFYNIGDEYKSHIDYPVPSNNMNNKLLIFFAGSPATMKYSTTYSGERIISLGGIPENLFREKCKEKA